MQMPTPLETPRLHLRCLKESDANQTYCDWLNNPVVNQYLESRFTHHTVDSIASFISEVNASPADLLLGLFRDQHHIGNIKIGPINDHHLHAPIGLMIGDQLSWGKGYATEAIKAVTNLAFTSLGIRKIVAGCYAPNVSSFKAFVKAGYIEEARLKSYWLLNGIRVDHLQLGITAEQWRTTAQ